MSTLPIEELELRALEQRNRLHARADELLAKVEQGRESLRVGKRVRKHFLGASMLVSLIAVGLGYGLAGTFTK